MGFVETAGAVVAKATTCRFPSVWYTGHATSSVRPSDRHSS